MPSDRTPDTGEIALLLRRVANGDMDADAELADRVHLWSSRPNPEVAADARRHTFSLDYELRLLEEADAVKATGGIGALRPREGLYSSHMTRLASQSPGPKHKPDSHQEELRKLQREILRLNDALARAMIGIEAGPTFY